MFDAETAADTLDAAAMPHTLIMQPPGTMLAALEEPPRHEMVIHGFKMSINEHFADAAACPHVTAPDDDAAKTFSR